MSNWKIAFLNPWLLGSVLLGIVFVVLNYAGMGVSDFAAGVAVGQAASLLGAASVIASRGLPMAKPAPPTEFRPSHGTVQPPIRDLNVQ